MSFPEASHAVGLGRPPAQPEWGAGCSPGSVTRPALHTRHGPGPSGMTAAHIRLTVSVTSFQKAPEAPPRAQDASCPPTGTRHCEPHFLEPLQLLGEDRGLVMAGALSPGQATRPLPLLLPKSPSRWPGAGSACPVGGGWLSSCLSLRAWGTRLTRFYCPIKTRSLEASCPRL